MYQFSPRLVTIDMSDQCATLVGAPAGDTPSEAVYDADKVYKVGLKEDLLDALKEIKFSGSFAVSGELRNLPPVIIDVPGVGKIKMPLEEGQARELIATARQAPYGKGAETVVDTAVRNTWELDAGQVSIQHPNWNSYLQLLVAKVKRMLGVTGGSIKAELYKMLIYEKGAMFKAHTE